MAKYCKECQYWEFKYRSGLEDWGTCDSSLVECHVEVDAEYEGEVVIHTSSKFGCIHHSPIHGNIVTKFPKLPGTPDS